MARKKLHFDQAAEQEANDIGKKFMNSQDVVGDMSRHYGADLSSVRIHHDDSAARQAAERGVDAFSTGTDVFFGRGAFDQSDPASRGLLAHELSHSLQQGVGGGQPAVAQSAPMGAQQGGLIDWFRKQKLKRQQKKALKAQKAQPQVQPQEDFMARTPQNRNFVMYWNKAQKDIEAVDQEGSGLKRSLAKRIGKNARGKDLSEMRLANADNSVTIGGMSANRMAPKFAPSMGLGMSKKQVNRLFDDLYAGQKAAAKSKKPLSQKKVSKLNKRFDRGIGTLKGLYLSQLRQMEGKYGKYVSQLHPDDVHSRVGPEFFKDFHLIQDVQELMKYGGSYFDYENNEDDREFRDLSNYYMSAYNTVGGYTVLAQELAENENQTEFTAAPEFMDIFSQLGDTQSAQALESKINGPGMDPEQYQKYLEDLKKSYAQNGRQSHLFGRFL